MRILLVEDELATQEVFQTAFNEQNFVVDSVTDAESAWELLQQYTYDLVVLDVMLPGLDGISLCRRLRQANNPVLVMLLTTRDHLDDKLLGLESGADDYLTKPIPLPELIARVRALSRRRPTIATSALSFENLRLNPVTREVTYANQLLRVGRKEYLLLELLLRNPQKVFNRSEIIDRLWGLDEEIPTEATVKSHIRNIRRKLELVGGGELIETLYGHGYRLNPALGKQPYQPLAEDDLKRLNELTTQVWQRAYTKSLNKITELEQLILSLQQNHQETARQEGVFAAHKLAGSLSVFGFEMAARLLRQIEDLLQQPHLPTPAVPQILQSLQAVRLELAGNPGSDCQQPIAQQAMP